MTEKEQRKQQRKYAAAERARLALKHSFERIDHHEDVVKPNLEAIKAGTLQFGPKGLEEILQIESGDDA